MCEIDRENGEKVGGGMYDGTKFSQCPYCFMRHWGKSPVAIFEGFGILSREAQQRLIQEKGK
jgi:hypothetical protein